MLRTSNRPWAQDRAAASTRRATHPAGPATRAWSESSVSSGLTSTLTVKDVSSTAAGQREFRNVQRSGVESVPGPRAAAIGREGEAAHRHEPRAGSARGWVTGGAGGQFAPGRRRGGEAPLPVAGQIADTAEGGQRGGAALGLLQTEPRLAGASRARDHRGGIDRPGTGRRDADQLRPAAGAGVPQRLLEPGRQPPPGGLVQPRRRTRRRGGFHVRKA